MKNVLIVLFYLFGIYIQKERFIMKLENFQNLQYYGKVYVGEDKKELDLIFSTTSGITWIKPDKINNNKISQNITNYNVFINLYR